MIAGNSIVICPNSLQRLLLKFRTKYPRIDFTMFSLIDLQNHLFGKCDDKGLAFLLKNSTHSFKSILSEVDYIQRGIDCSASLDIQETYDLLNNNYLLYRDSYIIELFRNKTVYILGYSKENIELNHVLDIINVNPVYLSLSSFLDSNEKTIFSFPNIDQELRYVLNKILNDDDKNICKGAAIRKKVLVCDVNNYESLIRMFAPEYGIKFSFKKGKSIKDTALGKELLFKCSQKLNLVEFLSSEVTLNKYHDKNLIDDLLNLIKQFDVDNLADSYNTLTLLLAKYTLNDNPKYEGEVIIQNNIGFDPDADYYVIGASDSFLPTLANNDGYFDDAILRKHFINSSEIKNIENEELTKNFVNSNLVKFISYHTVEGKNNIFHTTFVNNVVVGKTLNYTYSKSIAKAYYSRAVSIKKQYHENTFDLSFKTDIQSFDNSFKGIDRGNLLNKDIVLSYSALQEYYSCPFKYYCDYVLNISEFSETYSTKKGTFAHKIFEYITRSDFETALDSAKGQLDYEHSFTEKEKLLLEGTIPNLKHAYELLQNRFFNNPSFGQFYFEFGRKPDGKFQLVNVKDHVYLAGAIDSVLVTNNNEILILDYKTGSFDVPTEFSSSHGLNLQVLIYTYLLSNFEEFKGKEIAGSYYQRVHTKLLNKNTNNYENEFKLEGMLFKPDFKININADGNWFKKDEPFLTLDDAYNLVKEKAILAADSIRNNAFSIVPAKGYSNTGTLTIDGCSYCPFTCICYRKPIKEQSNSFTKEAKGK